MRRWSIIAACVLIPMAARANPYALNPSSLIAFGVVAISALFVEAAIVSLILTFAGIAPVRMLLAFLFANIVIFLFVFVPLQHRIVLPGLELMIVVIDAVAIKLLSMLSGLQNDSYRNVGWIFATFASLIGNAASFCVGMMATGELSKAMEGGIE